MLSEKSVYFWIHKLINVLLLSSVLLGVSSNESLVRKTYNGPVEGIELTSSLGQKYYAFKGVPYAEPPITGIDPYTGKRVDRRFKAPEPLERTWTSFKAHDFGGSCHVSSAFDESNVTRSEDCLSLNVYVPAAGTKSKTVLVWIYGGGFTEGDYTDAFYGPDFFLMEDVILVTIQFRVGIFGFLSLNDSEYSGNMGLKDQQLALKWIHENIENFSGNRNEVLIFGESTGGISVMHHMHNKESRKYFNRVFCMSGPYLHNYVLTDESHLKRIQECSNATDWNEMLEYLKTTNSTELTKCYYKSDWGKTILKSMWLPTVENPKTKSPFITQTAEEIYQSGNALPSDVLFSFTSQESIAFDTSLTNRTEPLIKANEFTLELPFPGFNGSTHPNEYRDAIEKLRRAYFSRANDIASIRLANIDFLTDLNYGFNILKNILHQIETNNNTNHQKNIFLLRIGINDELNLYKAINGLEYNGTAHGDELCYMFHCHMADEYKLYEKHLKDKNSRIFKTISRMVKIVTNFARTGNPSIDGNTPFIPCTSQTELFCQEINNSPKLSVTTNIKEQLHFDTWHEIETTYKSLQ